MTTERLKHNSSDAFAPSSRRVLRSPVAKSHAWQFLLNRLSVKARQIVCLEEPRELCTLRGLGQKPYFV